MLCSLRPPMTFRPKHKPHVELWVDCKENIGKIRKALLNAGALQKNLPVGDVWVVCRGKLVFIIERKALMDFNSSIRGTRNRCQKARLRTTGVLDIMYLIEDDKINPKFFLGIETIFGAMANTLARDSMSIFYSPHVSQSILLILKIWQSVSEFESLFDLERCPLGQDVIDDKLLDGESKEEESEGPTVPKLNRRTTLDIDTGPRLHVRRQNNWSTETCWIDMLSMVKGISRAKAAVIAKHYSMSALMELARDPHQLQSKIAALPLNDKRSLGPVAARNLHEFISSQLHPERPGSKE